MPPSTPKLQCSTRMCANAEIQRAPLCCAGKNRPLDEDELDFVNAVERSKAASERAWQDEQDREMDAFREVRDTWVIDRGAGRDGTCCVVVGKCSTQLTVFTLSHILVMHAGGQAARRGGGRGPKASRPRRGARPEALGGGGTAQPEARCDPEYVPEPC